MSSVIERSKDLTEGRGRRSLNYWWRLIATGFSFQIFGIGGTLLASAVALVFLLIPQRLICRKLAMRYVISHAFRAYIYLLRGLGLLTCTTQDLDRLRDSGQLIVANHPSLLDVVFIISLVRNADCIVRAGLCRNLLTAAPVRAAGYIRNVPERLLQRAVVSLQEGNSLIVFPEGTRTRPGRPMKFLRGAANIALMANKPVTPVVLTCEPATLLKHEQWHCIAETPPRYTIRVLPELDISEIIPEGMPQSKAARVLTRYLEQLFEEQLQQSVSSARHS